MSVDNTLEAISSAIEALKLQPELKAKIEHLELEVYHKLAEINSLHDSITVLNSRLDTQSASIADYRRELDEERFRVLELTEDRDILADKLDNIFGIAAPKFVPEPVAEAPKEVPYVPTAASTETPPTPFSVESAPMTTSGATVEPASPDVPTSRKLYRNTPYAHTPLELKYNDWLDNGGAEYLAHGTEF